MQFAISGTYLQGQIQLKELPPIDEPSDVMVVFLPKIVSNPQKGKTARLFGIAKNDNPVSDEEIEDELSELSNRSEKYLLDKWDNQV